MESDIFYKIKNIRKSEVANVLEMANMYLDSGKYEYNSTHEANRNFKVENDLALTEIPIIIKSMKIEDFCHKEIDRKFPTQGLYCFKLYINYSEELNDTLMKICDEEILVKFKFRTDADKVLFIMPLHYPDENKESWTWIWREN